MNYALDIAAAAAIVICVFAGAHRGAVRTLISALGYAAAFAAAVFVSNAADEYVYDALVRPAVISSMEARADELAETYASEDAVKSLIEKSSGKELSDEEVDALGKLLNGGEYLSEVLTNEEIRGKLNSVFVGYCQTLTDTFSGVLPDEITAEAERYIESVDEKSSAILDGAGAEGLSVTEMIEAEIVRPVMMKTVNAVLFALTFAAVCLIASVISRTAGLIRKIPAVRSADGLAGGLLGLLQGVLITSAVCVLVSVFVKLTSGENPSLNADTIAQTYVFKHFYNGIFYILSFLLKQ